MTKLDKVKVNEGPHFRDRDLKLGLLGFNKTKSVLKRVPLQVIS